MSQEYKKVKLKLDGKQSLSIPVDIKKNGRYITEDVDIIVRGFLKFEDKANTNTTLYESESYQRQSSNKLTDKVIIHPVLFTSDRIRVINGRGVFTLLPRAEDILEETKTVQDRAGSDITNDQIISNGGISVDEQILDPQKDPATIIIETGKIRTPYDISIEVTVVPITSGGLYSQTIDRGTNPIIDESISDSSLFSKQKTRISSNLIIECFGEGDWVPAITTILGTNSDNYETFSAELEDLTNSTPIGASTLYDAVVSAADILSDNSIDEIKKTIYIFTDNESSISTSSVDDSINEVNNIDGIKKSPLMISNMAIISPSTLSIKANTTDTRDLNKMSFKTGGQALTITSEDYLDDVTGIFYSEAVGSMGYGTYEFIVELTEEATINNITAYFDLPISNSNASWEIETSIDGYNYVALNKDYSANEIVEFTALSAKFIKFKIVLITGFNLDTDNPSRIIISPSLTSISIVYNLANVAYLYLNKEEEDIVPYHITLAVDSNEVEGNEIKVGVAKSDSGSWVDYYTPSQPTVNQNGKVVVPIRFSQDITKFQQEPLHKVDQFTLKMEYGSFDPFSAAVLYDKNDEIIPSNKYKLYPRDGVVILSFALDTNYVDGDYKVGILNTGEYKIGLELKNKSENQALELYGFSYMYSTERNLLPPISKASPEASNIEITNEAPNKFSVIEISYTYTDTNFDPEDLDSTRIIWYKNGEVQKYLNNIRKWNDITNPQDLFYTRTGLSYPSSSELEGDTIDVWVKKQEVSLLNAGDKVYCEVQVSDGELYDIRRKSNTVEILGVDPILKSQIFIKAMDENGNIGDRLSADRTAIIYPNLSEIFIGDGTDQSIVTWLVNDEIFKSGPVGSVSATKIPIEEIRINEIGNSNYVDYGLRMGNSVTVKITPKSGDKSGEEIISETVVVKNSLPQIYNLKFVGSKYSDLLPLIISFDYYDFEVTALDQENSSQKNQTTISWFRKNPGEANFTEVYRYNDQSNSLAETFLNSYYSGKIVTDLVTGTSSVSASGLFVGQKWICSVTPNDGIDDGETVTSEEIVINSSTN